MRFLTRSLTGLFLAALTIGLLIAAVLVVIRAGGGTEAGAPSRVAQERVFAANVIPFVSRTTTPTLTAYGEIRSETSLQLRAAASGRVLELGTNFADGAEVAEGDLLVQIDPTKATADRDTAQAALTEAQANLALANRTIEIARDDLAAARRQFDLRVQALDRQSQIDTRGLGRQVDTEAAQLAASAAEQAVLTKRTAMSSAEATLDQSRAALARQEIILAQAERDLADTRIIAPFAGRLADTTATQGGLVSANEQVATLIDPTRLEVAFRVSTAQFSRLLDAQGAVMAAPIEVVLPLQDIDLIAKATLTRVGAVVEAGASGRLLYARIIEEGRSLRPGDFVTLRLQEPPLENVAEIPARAVSPQNTVLVLDEGDRLAEVSVSVIRRQGDNVLVRGAADAEPLEGREIVAERSPLLGQGLKIRPTRAITEEGAEASTVGHFVDLAPERRAVLVLLVEANEQLSDAEKTRLLEQLRAPRVPAGIIAQLEAELEG
jgi:RND family efflux transporter MFP subunit